MNTANTFSQLANYLLAADSQEAMTSKLEALLTPSEIRSIAMRLEIAKQLQAGTPQREIAKNLGVGIATVTRGSRELKAGKFKV